MEDKKTNRGKNTNGLAVACLIWALRDENQPISIKEFELHTGISKKDLGSCVKLVQRTLNLVSKSSYADHLDRYCDALKLSKKTQLLIEETLNLIINRKYIN
jgi:transcription initiation factor TFIIIB Brf1 subunit/transcription initiation factor TFIIB